MAVTGDRLMLLNARSLVRAATVLADQHYYGHATSLLVLASEEAIKAIDLLIERSGLLGQLSFVDKSAKNRHKERHETAKTLALAIFYLRGEFQGDLSSETMTEALNEFFSKVQEDVKNMNVPTSLVRMMRFWDRANEIKNSGFYVDCEDGQWQYPLTTTSEDYKDVAECVNPILVSARLARIIMRYSKRPELRELWQVDMEKVVFDAVEQLSNKGELEPFRKIVKP